MGGIKIHKWIIGKPLMTARKYLKECGFSVRIFNENLATSVDKPDKPGKPDKPVKEKKLPVKEKKYIPDDRFRNRYNVCVDDSKDKNIIEVIYCG